MEFIKKTYICMFVFNTEFGYNNINLFCKWEEY